MLVIGLTGGIGSGKTTVAKLFERQGITIIDTDQLARDVTQRGQPALNEIAKKFSPNILNSDGSLNRTALRKIIFNDDDSRIWLENLLHPLIRAKITHKVAGVNSPYCIVVIPLLLEKEPNPLINRILVVDLPREEQIKRTQARDNLSQDEIKRIISTQVSRTERLAAADDIIDNFGSINDLIPQVNRLHGFYLALAQKK